MKILLAVDDSDAAAKVIRRLAKLAREFARPPAVHLLYVVPRLSEAAEKEFGKKGPGHYYAQQARVPLDQARAVLERVGLSFEAGYVVGEAAPSILAQAKALGVGMIVMGSRGKSPLKSLLIGSVAQKVVASSPVPVLLVR